MLFLKKHITPRKSVESSISQEGKQYTFVVIYNELFIIYNIYKMFA